MTKSLYGYHGPLAAPIGSPFRQFAASALRQASRTLARLARRLDTQHLARRRPPPEVEFYAESGAPEGALFLDGEFVGRIPGVNRL
jgi:hypothetical protein